MYRGIIIDPKPLEPPEETPPAKGLRKRVIRFTFRLAFAALALGLLGLAPAAFSLVRAHALQSALALFVYLLLCLWGWRLFAVSVVLLVGVLLRLDSVLRRRRVSPVASSEQGTV